MFFHFPVLLKQVVLYIHSWMISRDLPQIFTPQGVTLPYHMHCDLIYEKENWKLRKPTWVERAESILFYAATLAMKNIVSCKGKWLARLHICTVGLDAHIRTASELHIDSVYCTTSSKLKSVNRIICCLLEWCHMTVCHVVCCDISSFFDSVMYSDALSPNSGARVVQFPQLAGTVSVLKTCQALGESLQSVYWANYFCRNC